MGENSTSGRPWMGQVSLYNGRAPNYRYLDMGFGHARGSPVRAMWWATPATQCALCWKFGDPAAGCPKGQSNPQCCRMWRHRAHSESSSLPPMPRRTSYAKDRRCMPSPPPPQCVNCGADQPSLLSEACRIACGIACPHKQTGSRLSESSQLSYAPLPVNFPGGPFPRPWTSNPPGMTLLQPQCSPSSSAVPSLPTLRALPP